MLNARLNAKRTNITCSRLARAKNRLFTTYPQAVNYFLRKYITDVVTGKKKFETTPFPQSSNMLPYQYAKKLAPKILKRGDVYKEYVLNEIFIEGLDASIRHSTHKYWEKKTNAILHKLVFRQNILT